MFVSRMPLLSLVTSVALVAGCGGKQPPPNLNDVPLQAKAGEVTRVSLDAGKTAFKVSGAKELNRGDPQLTGKAPHKSYVVFRGKGAERVFVIDAVGEFVCTEGSTSSTTAYALTGNTLNVNTANVTDDYTVRVNPKTVEILLLESKSAPNAPKVAVFSNLTITVKYSSSLVADDHESIDDPTKGVTKVVRRRTYLWANPQIRFVRGDGSGRDVDYPNQAACDEVYTRLEKELPKMKPALTFGEMRRITFAEWVLILGVPLGTLAFLGFLALGLEQRRKR